MKGIDWQMVAFVGVSLFQEYLINIQLPKVYFWDQQFSNHHDDRKIA
ncbi:hypothetical protein AWH56_013065 [Anaerobacillus isosaccharinicus]|uniref:Uncharacterized protein n=1 Tax=Anaerobacillus isosaccharinicus TaxID=1532552 RepID=A0A7S7RDU5_9BACI|nr:hypothetical protein [Anaerobacillus isosaccharinicus]MBA5588174.1 hypothetical protein [Anaerobacillus isosaccharinicus]QOY38373.1 hypothetical protein AWH56_013065 [Anaerobacillus isosaccharinicus]